MHQIHAVCDTQKGDYAALVQDYGGREEKCEHTAMDLDIAALSRNDV